MKTTTIALIVALITLTAHGALAQEANDWHQVAAAVPLGSRIKVQTIDGRRVSGTLMRVDSNELLVKRNTRYPKPAVAVAFADVARIERHKEGGFNVAKAIAIGVASGAGAMVTLILFAMQID